MHCIVFQNALAGQEASGPARFTSCVLQNDVDLPYRAIRRNIASNELRMTRARGNQPTNELADSLRKLNAEKAQDWNNDQEDNAANELGIPMNLAGLGAVEATEERVAVHLEGHVESYADERENDKPC